MADPVGKPHAQETRERFESAHEQGLAEKSLRVKGAVSTLGHAYPDDYDTMCRICILLEDISNGLAPDDPSVGARVDEIVRKWCRA